MTMVMRGLTSFQLNNMYSSDLDINNICVHALDDEYRVAVEYDNQKASC